MEVLRNQNGINSLNIVSSYSQTSRHNEDGTVFFFEVNDQDKATIIASSNLLAFIIDKFLVRWGGC